MTMENDLQIIATYTYPHEAIFIQSALVSAGIKFTTRMHAPLIHNGFYVNNEQVKNIYVEHCDVKKVLKILHQISPDLHIKNRCTMIHTHELESSANSEPVEKGFCWVCCGLMIAGLGISFYAIIQSLSCIF